jgi:hypothetical protein
MLPQLQMGYNAQLSSFLMNWQSCIPIILAVYLFYFFTYFIGTIFSFPFSNRLIHQPKINILLAKFLIGILMFMLLVSIYFTAGTTINALIIIPLIALVFINYKKEVINFTHFKNYVRSDFKLFLFSFSIPLLILFVQFWKFDFFNSNTITVWCDYPYYAGIAKKMMIEHRESSYYTIPFSSLSTKYNFYHYSDIWICAGIERIISFVNGSDVYAYLYFTIAASILVLSFISTLNSNKKGISIFLILCFVVLFFNEIFNVHNHKSLIPFVCLIVFFKLLNAKRIRCAFALLFIVPILNPLFLFTIPFAISFFVMHKWSDEILQLIKNKKFILIAITAIILGVLSSIIFNQRILFSIIHDINNVFISETFELNFPKTIYLFGLVLVLSSFNPNYFKLSKAEILIIINCALLFTVGKVLSNTNYLGGFENWQIILTSKSILYLTISIVFARVITRLFSGFISYDMRFLFSILVLVVVVLQCSYNYYLYASNNRKYCYFFDRKVIVEIQKLLSEQNNVIGFYKSFQKQEPNLEYIFQRASASEFISITENIRKHSVWATPIFIHNRLDSLSETVRENWEKTAIYNFNMNKYCKSESELFSSFIKANNINIVLTDLPKNKLPQYIESKVKNYFLFHFNGKEYLMLAV